MENTTTPTQITIADLNLLKNIVDLASTRGAFRAGEMTQVGEVYDKLSKFLEEIVAQAQAQEEANAETSTDDSEPQGE